MSKKSRGPNFSSNEKEILIYLVTKYRDIVENKKTDATTTSTKNEGWRKLTAEFNSMSSFCVRNTEQLKTCWDNVKRITRKDKAKTKKEILLTGGGKPNLPPPGALQGQVEVLLGPTLDGLDNPFDSDAQFSHQTFSVDVTNTEPDIINENEVEVDMGSEHTLVQENKLAGLPGTIKSSEDALSQDKENKMWNGWSPAALKTKVSDPLASRKNSPSWLQRRRPKASLQDKVLESKLELVQIMKINAESEGKYKDLILEEQLKQEKIKTEMLELQLMEKKSCSREVHFKE